MLLWSCSVTKSQKLADNLAYDTGGGLALDFGGDVTIDKGAMAATCVFSTGARDRVGDVMEVAGIRTENHQRNPVTFWNHAKVLTLPIGKTKDPAGNYTVLIGEEAARQTTYFSQTLLEAEQIFDLIAEGIINANSIGFDTIKAQPIYTGGRKGLHIIESDLLEISWVGVPINQEAVTKAIHSLCCGRPLAPSIRGALEPYSLRRNAWANGATVEKCFDVRAMLLKSADFEGLTFSDDDAEEAGDTPDLADVEAVAAYIAEHYAPEELESAIEDWNDLMAENGISSRFVLTVDEDGDPIIEIADGPETTKGLRFWLAKS